MSLRISHNNNLPPYLQQRIDDAINQVLRDYMKKDGRYVRLLVGEKIPMIKTSYRATPRPIGECKDLISPFFD